MTRHPGARALVVALLALTALQGCAYYNTFYLSRKYYYRATLGEPYAIDGPSSQQVQNYNKAIDYSKKLIANYPKSKWVDDAWLMWARALIGRDDPLQTATMLRDFTVKYPESPLVNEATFYLGLAFRAARRNAEAVATLDEFLSKAPKDALAPYAHFERARALLALQRPGDAADAAGVVLERWPKSTLAERSRSLRAEARFAQGAFDDARADYNYMGTHSRTDEERFNFLLREADCIEGARRYDESLALLQDAISHERAPVHGDTTGGKVYAAPVGVGADRFGRLTIRIGTVHLLAGRLEPALEAYRRTIFDYPRTGLAAEAQYRIGYAYETVADDFASAREAYAKVKEQGGSQTFIAQAAQRLATLDQIEKFRVAGGDSLQRRAEKHFLLAEQYLFQLDKPERALDQYAQVVDSLGGTSWAAKAMTAQGWVLSHKLSRESEAESLWWHVVREFPATEAQLAARDYLERAGQVVPPELIKLPQAPLPPADTTRLTPPPDVPPLGGLPPSRLYGADSLRVAPRGVAAPGGALSSPPPPAAPDSLRAPGAMPPGPMFPAGRDSLGRPIYPPRDTTSRKP